MFNSQVGPGAYLGHTARQPGSAPVPFHTSAERALMENTTTSAMTPGPGAYESAHAADVLHKLTAQSTGSSAAFAHGMPRLAEDKTRAYVPG